MFYGDSITEQLRDLNGVCGLWGCPEGGEVSQRVLGKWRSINMAIGGAICNIVEHMLVGCGWTVDCEGV